MVVATDVLKPVGRPDQDAAWSSSGRRRRPHVSLETSATLGIQVLDYRLHPVDLPPSVFRFAQ
jgi:hypothetical protein